MSLSENPGLRAPTLPADGGTITGLKGSVSASGPDGAAILTLPLPVSAGRGYAPDLTLRYHSRSGNGPFGMGWDVRPASVRLRTRHGVPAWDDTDEFTGPDGEVLVPAMTPAGTPDVRTGVTALLGTALSGPHAVHAYRSRTESSFSRLEYWVPADGTGRPFWVIYRPGGQVHLLGRNAQARISNPAAPSQAAVWLEEASVSVTGEQIYWQYRAEDDAGCDDTEKSNHPAATAQRYLAAVWYGNRKAGRSLPGLTASPGIQDWLFTLVLDYGERATDPTVAPAWLMPGQGSWPCRPDSFSSREYGFDIRTRRLCRQVLMYHAVSALAGSSAAGDTPQLVARLCLDYNADPAVSTLSAVHQVAYEADGTPCALPSLTLDWQTFTPPAAPQWQLRTDMGGMSPRMPYQMVDLNGEGLAGILYQDQGAWWYRAPVRHPEEGENGVTWDTPRPLPALPVLQEGGTLADVNGDGRLEWLVTAPGVSGHYDRMPDATWRHFTPLSALPTEYAHPRARLADVAGAGLTDLVLIGPKSVRLYCGTGEGWQMAQTVMQADGVTLPVPGADPCSLVAFSDMDGSGLQHLVEVRPEGVRYWPNAGHGRFGAPVRMSGFSPATELPAEHFNPDRLYLADTDGSGTTDLIYACSTQLRVYRNLAGNAFSAPFIVPLPPGVQYDHSSRLQVADVQGLGMASLVLTVTHPRLSHYVCHLSDSKPWLLSTMNNHAGARHAFFWRSSVQFWLDEKAEAATAGRPAPGCYLPLALHTLARTTVTDEISGNQLASTRRYRHGAWDGREREFRGFGMAETRDTDNLASPGTTALISMPAVSRHWFATGIPEVDSQLPAEYWAGDAAAFSPFTPRFTTGSGENEKTYTPDSAMVFWLERGLKGLPLRSELYGADGGSQAGTPYSVTEYHPQVRLVEQKGAYPVVWPAAAESRVYTYERVSSDPLCSQQVLLQSDEYGNALRQVSVSYPRRPAPASSPYPYTLPDTLFAGSFDEQQQVLRLALQQNRWHTLSDPADGVWLTGLPDATRRDIFIHPAAAVPAEGLTVQGLEDSGLLADTLSPAPAGQRQVWYQDGTGAATPTAPAFPPRPLFTETALLDEDTLTSLATDFTPERLTQAGYTPVNYLFPRTGEAGKTRQAVRQGYITYAGAEHFWLPVGWRDSQLTGALSATRDAHDCVITGITDAAGLQTLAEYDWRFLTPVRITNASGAVQSATLDALGRLTTLRVSGTEAGVAAGYSNDPLALPRTADGMLSLKAPLPVAQCMLYVTDSWQDGRGLPPHVVTLTTDRYDRPDAEKAAQQVRQQVIFRDGFGRTLQAAVRQTDGEAWQRANDGSLVVGPDGTPAVAQTTFRWAVSGRKEYDNKGQMVRSYQPYFLDSWQYVCDDSARKDMYADTHYHDPVGREWRTVTAKGWQRRTLFTPWFTVREDENEAPLNGVM